MIGISEPKTLKNQHIISLKIKVFSCIGSQTKECINFNAGFIDVGDRCCRQTASHQHLEVNKIHLSTTSMFRSDGYIVLVTDGGDQMCWLQVWDVDGRFRMLKNVTNIMILPPTTQISHHQRVFNIMMSPTSLSPYIIHSFLNQALSSVIKFVFHFVIVEH